MTHHHIAYLIVMTALCLAPLALLFGVDLARIVGAMVLEFVIVIFIARGSRVDERTR